jgi:excisionase family DNA binding protein
MSSERAPNLNQVVLVGQLTQDPDIRQMPDGRSVCNLRLAVNDRTDQQALFIDIATFGPTCRRLRHPTTKAAKSPSPDGSSRRNGKQRRARNAPSTKSSATSSSAPEAARPPPGRAKPRMPSSSVPRHLSPTGEITPPVRPLDGPLLTPHQAAQLLNVKTSWNYEAVRTRRLPCIRIGRHIRFTRAMLEDWLDVR